MSKVGGALPSWYWPVGVPRRVPVAQQPLGRVFRQKFLTAKDRPALVSHNARLSYGELLEQSLALAGGIQAAGLDGTIAIADPDPVQSLLLCMAGLFAGRCVFLADPADSAEQLAARLAEAKASALIASDGAALPQGAAVRIVAEERTEGNLQRQGNGEASNRARATPSHWPRCRRALAFFGVRDGRLDGGFHFPAAGDSLPVHGTGDKLVGNAYRYLACAFAGPANRLRPLRGV